LDANYYRVAIIGPWPEGVKSSQPPQAENADELFDIHAAAAVDIAEELRKRAENRCNGRAETYLPNRRADTRSAGVLSCPALLFSPRMPPYSAAQRR
jgi:hypothetical protein